MLPAPPSAFTGDSAEQHVPVGDQFKVAFGVGSECSLHGHSPYLPTATGTVTFLDGQTTLGTGTLSGGVATFQTSGLTAGTHLIGASYPGDAADTATNATQITQIVQNTSTTTLSVQPSGTSEFGTAAILTATVTPSAAIGFVENFFRRSRVPRQQSTGELEAPSTFHAVPRSRRPRADSALRR